MQALRHLKREKTRKSRQNTKNTKKPQSGISTSPGINHNPGSDLPGTLTVHVVTLPGTLTVRCSMYCVPVCTLTAVILSTVCHPFWPF